MRRPLVFLFLAMALVVGSAGYGLPDTQGVSRESVIVVLDQDVDSAAVAREMAAHHRAQVRHVYTHALKGFVAEVPASALAALQRDPRVAWVEVERAEHIVAQVIPTGVDRIEADLNPTITTDGSGSGEPQVKLDVAIIDTGISSHSDLNVAGGRNFSGGSASNWSDGNGHGTHVAGTVGAIDNGNGVVGVAPGANLWAVKVCKNGGICLTGDIVAGIDWVAGQKATRAIDFAAANFSISSADSDKSCEDPANATHRAICGLVDEGVVFVMAAGNDNRVKVPYPVAFSVSAIADFDGKAGGDGSPTCRSDTDDTLADFSNHGEKVNIAAPGVCILSTWNDGGYNTISGTSMAAPHVTGAVALYLHANGLAPAQDTTGANEITDAIIKAALPQGTGNHECSYDDSRIGGPLLFVNAAAFKGSGSCEVAGETTTGTISGTVTDNDPSEPQPIQGATVSVDGTTLSATTNAEGNYTIEDVPTGTHNVTASADGYQSQTKEATVGEDTTTTVDFALEAVSAGDNDMWVYDIVPSTSQTGIFTNVISTVTIWSKDGPVAGASITYVLERNQSAEAGECGVVTSYEEPFSFSTTTTNSNGQATFTLRTLAPNGCWRGTVTGLTHSDYNWNQDLDHHNPRLWEIRNGSVVWVSE